MQTLWLDLDLNPIPLRNHLRYPTSFLPSGSTRWVFSGTGLELVTRQATIQYLHHSTTATTVLSESVEKVHINNYAAKAGEHLVRPKYAPRRNKEKFQQLTEFEWGRIIGLREGGFSYHAKGARVQRNSSTVIRVWKQWTDEHQTTQKTGSGRRKVTSECDDRHLLRLAVNDRTVSCVIERHSGLTTRVRVRLRVIDDATCYELRVISTATATRGLLATDHVILNHGQVTWTTPELAPPLLTTTPHQREDVSALDRFNVHRCPTRRVFSGTGIELMTCLPWLDTLTTGLPQPLSWFLRPRVYYCITVANISYCLDWLIGYT
ncbi:uncharacterized protein TNCV_3756011 [Trichonephila clavipes]|nr:uncharacterized protein TNCV_3756011 [Trichonephila clavipes]